jgi:hypothetical protein
MRTRALVIGFALVAGLSVPSAFADETTYCNAYITTLPYTITTQGHYCFNTNLSTAITTGAAITINADHVVLDLNNFKLGGGAAGPATEAQGIYVHNHSNITIRGGNIRGFAWGVLVEGIRSTSSSNIVIENNVFADNTMVAVAFMGQAITVRNNVISHTGGSTVQANPMCGITFGISTVHRCVDLIDLADSAIIVDNTIIGTFPPADEAFVFAIYASAPGGSLVANNRLVDTSGDGAVLVLNDLAHGVCRDNTSAKATTPLGFVCAVLIGTNASN